jgi:hypothetical protein
MGLADQDRGAGALFPEEQRVCQRCDNRAPRPDRVTWGADATEWHRCPDGEYGVLELVHPRPGREVKDPAVVDFDPTKEEPRPS